MYKSQYLGCNLSLIRIGLLFDPLDSLYENEHKISVSNQYWNDIRFLLFDNSGLSGSFFRRFAITVAIEFVYEIIEPIVEE